MEYLYHILIMTGIYSILATAANIPVGLINLLSLAQASFYGIGAYLSALMMLNSGVPVFIALPTVMLLTGIASLFISLAAIRLKEDYFILATLAFQLIVYSIMHNWTTVTHGTYGISGIAAPFLWGHIAISGNGAFAALTIFLTALISGLFYQLVNSPYGRILKAIQTDELSVAVAGRNVNRFKISAFFLSASFTAVAGYLFAGYVKYIDPGSFTLDESIFILSALFIGGLGNVKGCLIGALFIVLLPELLRFAGLSDTIAANTRQIIYGLCLILVVRFFPKGIAGEIVLK